MKRMRGLFATILGCCASIVLASGLEPGADLNPQEDLAGYLRGLDAAQAEPIRPKMASAPLANAADTKITATGDLNISRQTGQSIYLYFQVPSTITKVTSASVSLNAYDVDYPSATEHDKVYFNDTYIGSLQGYDNGWEMNSFVVPADLIKTGQKNTMRIHVDVDKLGWVTRVQQVVLTLNGTGGVSGSVTLTASSSLVNKIQLDWASTVANASYNIYRGTKADQLTLLVEKTTATSYTDKAVTGGQKYYYQIMTISGVSSAIVEGTYLVPSLTLQASGDLYRKIELVWTPKNCTAPYVVYRGATAAEAADPAKRTRVASGLSGTSFIDSTVTGGQTYYYQVEDSIGTKSTAVSGTSKATGALLTETTGGATWTYFKTGSDVTVYGVSGTSAAELTVPEQLGGCPVREIEYRAFAGLAVRKLYLPTTLARLCRGAFAGASNLTGVYFLGDKPTFAAKALEGTSTSLTVYARASASGWADSAASRPPKLTTGDGTSRNLLHCWTVTVTSSEHGSISGASTGWYSAGTDLTLTAKPAAHYILLRWTGDMADCTLSGNVATVPVTRDRLIGVEFTEDVYQPTLEAGRGETRLEWELVVGEGRDAAFVVSNPHHGAQSKLEVSVIGCPASCELTYTMPEMIAADSTAMLTFHAKALAASPSSAWETFTIRVTTAEGGAIDIPAAFHAVSERARLMTVEERLVSTMAIGEHTEVSFTLVNDTGVETGRIRLNHTGYAWLSVVGPKTLPSLGAGESRTVTLALDPPEEGEWSQSFAYEGNVTFSCEEGTGGDIHFAFTPVTDKTGAVRVVCKDNSGEDATYVAFAGATVSLLDAVTLEEIANGVSDANGICMLSDLPVGRYVIGVTAPDHNTYKAVIYVRAGQQADVRALMSVAIVTGRAEFRWIEIEDEYVLVYTPQIVHVVPAPNVEWTVNPRTLAEGDTTIVQMHVKNTGLVRATSVTFAFPAYPAATHHIQFSANGFPLDPGEERDVTVRFVCDDAACTGTGRNRGAYATMNVAYTSSDPESGETKTVGYCDGKLVLHGNVPVPEYELPVLVFTTPENQTGDKRMYDPDYELLNSGRVVFKRGTFEGEETVEWPKKPRPDAVVPVTLEIRQPVALKRDVIEGSFVFSNKSETAEAYVHLDIEIVNAAGEDCRHLFTIVATNTANDGSVPLDGERLRTGEVTLAALREGRAGFWFVPTRDAAPTAPVDYYFGGSFIYRIGPGGTPQTNDLMLCKMTVSPMPFLKMDYFTQRDVFSDNPFTDVAEAYQPAEFALRVRNLGGGAAKNVRIASSRPKIVENESNLVVEYDLRNWSYASYLDGTSKTLDLDTVNLGTIPAGATTVAEWLFVSTLEGHFTTNGQARLEYTMPWQNSETTQISEDVGVHLLVHRCDGDGDGIVDFLTSERSTGAPDKLWCSAAEDPVPVSTDATATVVGDSELDGVSDTITIAVTSETAGPVYVSVAVEDAKTYRVSALSREGVALSADNAWATDRTYVPIDLSTAFGSRPIREGRIHLFDTFAAAGTRTYTVTLTPRFAYVVGDEEGGYRIGDTYSKSVPTETVPKEVQRFCSGWTALCDGEEIASGKDGEVSFMLADVGAYETVLDWMTNFWISAENSDNGSVRFVPLNNNSRRSDCLAESNQEPEESWYAAGSNVRLMAVPDTGYCLDRWTGDIDACASDPGSDTLVVPVDRARTISASFKRLSQTVHLEDAGHSATIPTAGDFVSEYWSVVTVDVAQVQINCGPTQYVCKGWTAENADPSSGEGGHAVFTVRGDISLHWLWQTNVVTLAEAVNAPNLAWTTGGARDWTPEWNVDAADGDHQAVIGAIANNTNAWLETTVTGPGVLTFVWRSALAGKNTKMQFYVDGVARGILVGTNGWTTVEETLSEMGTHTFRWRLFTGRSGAAPGDCAALDKVVWTPPEPPTFGEALNADLDWTTEGDVPWKSVSRESLLEPRENWAVVKGLGDDECASLVAHVYGTGVLSFDWAVSCEKDYDGLEVSVDGVVRSEISGDEEWAVASVEINGECWHTVCWTYAKDEMDDPALAGENTAMLDNVVWTSETGLPPRITDDAEATVTGNVTDGFVITPSSDCTTVVVEIPATTPADKVTVVAPHDLAHITLNGANLRIMKGHYDLTEYLALPAADASGSIALAEATVKAEIVKEALDPAEGAEIVLNQTSPMLKIAETKPGLVYTLREGTSLESMADGDSKVGDGQPWTPDITVKDGSSAFYSIKVEK